MQITQEGWEIADKTKKDAIMGPKERKEMYKLYIEQLRWPTHDKRKEKEWIQS